MSLTAKQAKTTAPPALSDALGRSLHDLRLSVIDRCNFRCTYCMPDNEEAPKLRFLPRADYLDFDELEKLARTFVALGVRKIRLTGGEPLLRKNLADLVRRLSAIPGLDDLALTTNGLLLAGQARALAAAGLNRVTVSLDSVDPEVFAAMNGGRAGLERVLDGIDRAAAAGLGPIKINAVIQRGVNEHSMLDLFGHFRGSGHIVRLIEYMDVGTENHWRPDDVVTTREMLARISARWPLAPLPKCYPGEVARRYRYLDGAGEIGFISSISAPFCGDCSRARVSPDGQLYTCLFAEQGTDLTEALRRPDDGEALAEQLRALWSARADRYSEQRVEPRSFEVPLERIEMYRIGG